MARLFIASLLLGVFLCTPALGQVPCGEREDVVRNLSQYHEFVIGIGVTANGHILELWSSRKGETFTIVRSLPNGLSCLVGAGENWEALPLPAKGEGS